jgi:hypothetical protein
VLIPKSGYIGQKLTSDVNTNTAANAKRTYDMGAVTTFIKNNTIKTRARIILIILSVDPIFAFIINWF